MTRMGVGRGVWTCAFAGALTLVVSGVAAAQVHYTAQDADDAFAQLSSEVPGLRANWNFETGFPSFMFGRPIRLFGVPQNDAEYEAAARRLVDLYPGLFGFDSSALVTEQVKHIRMTQIGTTDKVSVGFTQWVGGLPVDAGSVSVLFNFDGAIVGIENNGIPNSAEVDVVPSISEAEATVLALREFAHPGAKVLGVDISVVPNQLKGAGELAWSIDLGGIWDAAKGLPLQEKIQVDAHSGGVIRRLNTIFTFTDLLGQERQWRTPGTLPDNASNPVQKFKYMRGYATSAVGSTNTDANGDWTITYSGSSNQTVTFKFSTSSLYAWVTNKVGSDYTKTITATPGVKIFDALNKYPGQYQTAQNNAQGEGVAFREWVVGLDPSETKMDFRQHLNANINSSCNAYYDGSSTNYYKKLGGCENTAYSTVIAHETGHWANDKFSSGNGGDGFGEGTSDTWAMYIYDNPIVGEDFFTSGGDIRTGLNTRQYCGSCGSGCYGEVHADGEVLMGAFWKVRDHLNTTLGDAAGDSVIDNLFLDWYQGYNASTICDTNETQILTLDDDNGNILDGTPHSADIELGFEAQGYPGNY